MPIRIDENYEFPTARFEPLKPEVNKQDKKIKHLKMLLETIYPQAAAEAKFKAQEMTQEVKTAEKAQEMTQEVKTAEKDGLYQTAKKFLKEAVFTFKVFMQKIYIPYGKAEQKYTSTPKEDIQDLKECLKEIETPIQKGDVLALTGRKLSSARTADSDHSEAIKYYEQSLNSYTESLNTSSEVKRRINNNLKELAILHKDPRKKIELYEKIQGEAPSLLTTEKLQLSEAYEQIAVEEAKLGHNEKAKEYYGKAVNLYKGYASDMKQADTEGEIEGKLELMKFRRDKEIYQM